MTPVVSHRPETSFLPGNNHYAIIRFFHRFILVIALCPLLFFSACSVSNEEEDLMKAELLFEKGLHKEALLAFEDYLRKYPDGPNNAKVLFRKAEILYFALGKKGPAAHIFSKLVSQYTYDEYGFRAREKLAGIYRDELNDYLHAIVEYRWLQAGWPNSPRADEFQYQVAHLLFLANNPKKAIKEFQRFIYKFPDSAFIEQAYDEIGSSHLILGHPEEALFVFKELIEKYPESPIRSTIEFKIGDCYETMGRLDEALKQYEYIRENYQNWPALEIRIKGVKARQKDKNRS